MKKLVCGLLLSLLLIVSITVEYSNAETSPQVNIEQKCSASSLCTANHIDLEKRANELGITVDQLKNNMKADRQARLEMKAKELGITVDQLKAKMKAERQVRLEKKAKELGITVDQLKAKIKSEH